VLVQSAIGETASSLTPLRAGGEPARVWAMTRQGVPGRVGFVVVGVELLATSVVIVLTGLVLGVTVAPEWWAAAGPGLVRSAVRGWPWLAAIGAAMLGAWLLARRLRPTCCTPRARSSRRPAGTSATCRRGSTSPTSRSPLVNIGVRSPSSRSSRRRSTGPPPLAATVVGSYALLYAQAVIPTPARRGAPSRWGPGRRGGPRRGEAALLVVWRILHDAAGTRVGVALGLWRSMPTSCGSPLAAPTRSPPATVPNERRLAARRYSARRVHRATTATAPPRR
jgi:hypothetical protein